MYGISYDQKTWWNVEMGANWKTWWFIESCNLSMLMNHEPHIHEFFFDEPTNWFIGSSCLFKKKPYKMPLQHLEAPSLLNPVFRIRYTPTKCVPRGMGQRLQMARAPRKGPKGIDELRNQTLLTIHWSVFGLCVTFDEFELTNLQFWEKLRSVFKFVLVSSGNIFSSGF